MFIPINALTQGQNNNWYFGFNAGITFNTNPASPIQSDMIAFEGCATISDPGGSLLFYSNGITVWDRNHNVMPNGNDLLGGESSYSAALIVPFPNSTHQYYLFTTEDQTTNGGLHFSIVDMRLNNGFGDIVVGSKNTLVVDQVSEKVTSILHSNGTDIWILTHKLNSQDFLAYLLSDTGLNINPVVSTIGSFYPLQAFIGPIKASQDRSKVVSSVTFFNILDEFDFNNTTGSLTNYRNLNQFFPNLPFVFGVEYSPNDSLLYLSSGFPDKNLYQLHLLTGLVSSIYEFNPPDCCTALQLGPDNKIYMSRYLDENLDIIHFPNLEGDLCQFEEKGIMLANGTFGAGGLPSFVPYSFFLEAKAEPSLGNDTILCEGDALTLSIDYTINCDSLNILWSNGLEDPEIVINDPGLYWVQIQSACETILDTIKVDYVSCLPIIHYSLENCRAYMEDNSHMNYQEFSPSYPHPITCGIVSADTLSRAAVPENKHSCTAGIGDSIAMCINSNTNCQYTPNHSSAISIDFLIIPEKDSIVKLTGFQFYQKAPLTYSWIDGPLGLNNYPVKYSIRITKNNKEIYSAIDIPTTLDWTLKHISFISDTNFIISDTFHFSVQLQAHCPIGNQGEVSVWDLDEISIFGGCLIQLNHDSNLSGSVSTREQKLISEVNIKLSNDSSFSIAETQITNSEGIYSFTDVNQSQDVFLRGYKNDDVLNGVTILDLLIIQNYLLGKIQFDSLELLIAADINKDNKITVLDLIELKKVLLGMSLEFPRNASWRFCSSSQNFNTNEFQDFRELIMIPANSHPNSNSNFVGIKIGDLNGDVQLK